MKKRDIPLTILLLFTLIYSVFGNPENSVWSGYYFIVNYLTMFMLFKNEKSKTNRIIGMALSFSILIYVIFKFVFNLHYDRYFTLFVFIIALLSLIKIEKK